MENKYDVLNLNCSKRVIHALYRCKIKDIRQLYNMSDEELLKIKNLGLKSLKDLKQGLDSFNPDTVINKPIKKEKEPEITLRMLFVLKKYYIEHKTLKEISGAISVSPERVRQIKAKATRRLLKIHKDKTITQILEEIL